jgi:hypothetical protein
MRPYITFHETPGVPLRYPLSKLRKDDARFIGGTVDWRGPSRTTADLKNMVGFDSSLPRKPWLHITLSLPVGLTLDNDEWLELVAEMLEALEFPADAVPFLCFKHPVSKHNDAEHAHVLMLPKTFAGRWLSCEGFKRRCDYATEVLRHKLGLGISHSSPFALNFPERKQKYTQHQHIASMVNSILQYFQPVDFKEFRRALWDYGEVALDLKPNCYGADSYVLSYQCLQGLRGGELSKELTPKNLALKFQLNRQLRDARVVIGLRKLLDMDPEVRTQLGNFLRRVKNDYGRHFHEDRALLSQLPVYSPVNGQERQENGKNNRADQDGCERVAALARVVDQTRRAGVGVGQWLATGSRSGFRATGADREFDFSSLGQPRPPERSHHGAGSSAKQGKHPLGTDSLGRGFDPGFDGQGRSHPSRRANIVGRPVRRSGLGFAMMQAKRLATRLGLAVKVTLMRSTRSLGLKFEDRSALLMSPAGCQLATAGRAGCHAKLFAQAHARSMSWYDFQKNKDWLVPIPSAAGDWLAAPRKSLEEIRGQILATSEIHVLSSGSLVLDELAKEFAQIEIHPAVHPQLNPSPQKFLFVTPSCIGVSIEALAAQADEVEALAADNPFLRVVMFSKDDGTGTGWSAQAFSDYLLDSVPLLQDSQEISSPGF